VFYSLIYIDKKYKLKSILKKLLSIPDLLKRNESQNLEFKETFNKETIETVAAFSNVSGGTIIIGVSDKGKLIGVKASNEIIKDWTNSIKQMTQPQIFPEINLHKINNHTVASILPEYPDVIFNFESQAGFSIAIL